MRLSLIVILVTAVLATGCHQRKPGIVDRKDRIPEIFPDYAGVTVPFNIAPLNFRVNDRSEGLLVKINVRDFTKEFNFRGNKVLFPAREWEQLLTEYAGDDMEVSVSTINGDTLNTYEPFVIHISSEKTDDFLVYRLLMPGFQNWNQMGIYERKLSSFREKTVIDSRILSGTCMNCHTFALNDPEYMVFHLREFYGGTMLYRNHKLEKLNTRAGKMFANAAFPSWHPSGYYIAFSVNRVNQVFHAMGTFRAAAVDMKSDIFIYDIEKNEMLTSPALSAGDNFETFPCFSADGTKLYYCSADSVQMPQKFDSVRYSLCSVSFNPESGLIGDVPDTIISSSSAGKSVSLPRVSPDGKFLMFVMSDYGCFPSYNPEADLWLMDLQTREYKPLTPLNSNSVESWHSWSSGGRWVVFSSRRLNGLHSNPFIAFIDKEGNPGKPFLLPQRDPGFYDSFLFSYNVPEFIKSGVKVKPYQIEKTARTTKGIQVQSGSGH